MREDFIYYGAEYELVLLVFSIVGAVIFISLTLFFLFIIVKAIFIGDDKEIEFLNTLSDDEKLLISKYKLAKRVHTKELFKKRIKVKDTANHE